VPTLNFSGGGWGMDGDRTDPPQQVLSGDGSMEWEGTPE
jgi:hypothetical protein